MMMELSPSSRLWIGLRKHWVSGHMAPRKESLLTTKYRSCNTSCYIHPRTWDAFGRRVEEEARGPHRN